METASAPLSRTLRERAFAFAAFVWHRFLDEDCFSAAGSLSFTTVFALVPLTTAIFGILAAFPVFQQWSNALTDFVFANFVPAAAKAMQTYLVDFAGNASKLTSAGVIALVVSALLMMSSVEQSFNRIFRAPPRRRQLARFVVFWTVLSLGPILVAASLGLSSYLFALPGLDTATSELHLVERLLRLLPTVVTWSALTLAYLVIPNGAVRLRHAVAGAVLAGVLFELTKQVFAQYLASASYEQIYGVLAAVPIFLLWIYVSWVVVLIGASITASLSAFRYVPRDLRISAGLEFAALLRVFAQVAAGSRAGLPPGRNALAAGEPHLSDAQLDRMLGELRDLRCAYRTDSGNWVLLRDPAAVTLAELFEAGPYRWPTAAELSRWRGRAGSAEPAMLGLFDAATASQEQLLGRPAAGFFPPP
jgi:membrane protein